MYPLGRFLSRYSQLFVPFLVHSFRFIVSFYVPLRPVALYLLCTFSSRTVSFSIHLCISLLSFILVHEITLFGVPYLVHRFKGTRSE